MRLARVSNTAHSTDTHQPADERSEFLRGGDSLQTRAGKRVQRPARESPRAERERGKEWREGGTAGCRVSGAEETEAARTARATTAKRRHRRSGAAKERAAQGEKRERTLRKAKRDGATRATGEAGGARHDARERARHGAQRRGNRS
jgi:hypothetical protein